MIGHQKDLELTGTLGNVLILIYDCPEVAPHHLAQRGLCLCKETYSKYHFKRTDQILFGVSYLGTASWRSSIPTRTTSDWASQLF